MRSRVLNSSVGVTMPFWFTVAMAASLPASESRCRPAAASLIKVGFVIGSDLVEAKMQLVFVVFGGDEQHRTRLRHFADPALVAAEHGGDGELLHQ